MVPGRDVFGDWGGTCPRKKRPATFQDSRVRHTARGIGRKDHVLATKRYFPMSVRLTDAVLSRINDALK
jgi:hypothetical protein